MLHYGTPATVYQHVLIVKGVEYLKPIASQAAGHPYLDASRAGRGCLFR